ncbi:MAG: HD domain-containing protein [Candidatus Harrisonbacteria bacterium]|nr:HD domain-containing protein [Candidatus Harrisonbacteria bacterium]
MKLEFKQKLINIAREKIEGNDSSHDFEHARRVLSNVELISKVEGGDLDILIPAALFHDVVIYPKNDPKSKNAPHESALMAGEILKMEIDYPPHKISAVENAIRECSFHKESAPNDTETRILRDADKLEATGIISIMRTYASCGQMNRPFYNSDDPFCDNRKPEPFKYALDLFYDRLLVAKDKMYTKTAREIAEKRTNFLKIFIEELKRELKQ